MTIGRHVAGVDGGWREVMFPFVYAPALNAIRLDFNLGMGGTVDVDSIALRQVDSKEYAAWFGRS